MFYRFIFSLILFSSALLEAQENEAHKNKIKIDKKLLVEDMFDEIFKNSDVDYKSIDWNIIDKKCLPKTSNYEYNKCRINLGLNYYYFQIDNKFCSNKSEEHISKEIVTSYSLTKNDPINPESPHFNEDNLLKVNEKNNTLDNIIYSEYYRCMKSKDWLDPENWSNGKSFKFYLITESNYITIN